MTLLYIPVTKRDKWTWIRTKHGQASFSAWAISADTHQLPEARVIRLPAPETFSNWSSVNFSYAWQHWIFSSLYIIRWHLLYDNDFCIMTYQDMYRESSPYKNFITANFITAIFQNFPEKFCWCIFWAILFHYCYFWAILGSKIALMK